MKMQVCLGLTFWTLLGAAALNAAPDNDDPAKDLAKMQGKWQCVEGDNNGTVTKSTEGYIMIINKDVMITLDGDGKPNAKSSMKLDPSKSPKTMDLTCITNVLFPETKGTTSPAIYELEDDQLKIAFTYAPYRDRPGTFTTKKGSHFFVETLKRVKP
jgi:uncharacterized protein (TIGR03067 family)